MLRVGGYLLRVQPRTWTGRLVDVSVLSGSEYPAAFPRYVRTGTGRNFDIASRVELERGGGRTVLRWLFVPEVLSRVLAPGAQISLHGLSTVRANFVFAVSRDRQTFRDDEESARMMELVVSEAHPLLGIGRGYRYSSFVYGTLFNVAAALAVAGVGVAVYLALSSGVAGNTVAGWGEAVHAGAGLAAGVGLSEFLRWRPRDPAATVRSCLAARAA